MKKTLSIIILNYNTKKLTQDCVDSILKNTTKRLDYEIILVDNNSFDGSKKLIKKLARNNNRIKAVFNTKNKGFAAGNNSAKKKASGEYILFLNSDTLINKNTLEKTVSYMKKNKAVGALTCKTLLLNGKLDKDTRRSFPTPWVALTHFTGLDRLFPKSKLFAKYWYGYIGEDILHEVDVLQGAFFLTKRTILDKVGWFDESYFLDGEDIDLSWKIKKLDKKIVYYPKVSITHIKKASKSKSKKLKNVMAGADSMEKFYKKHLMKKYPTWTTGIILLGIKLLKLVRYVRFQLEQS